MSSSELDARIARAMEDSYTVIRRLGKGTVARTYLAEDIAYRRKVVVKVLRPDVADTIAEDRFLQEIQIVARLSHPGIVPLFQSGQVEGLPYYVMPYEEGESLRERLVREGPLPLSEAVRIAREVAEALGHAHARGVIHRDIKPENILCSQGHSLVTDFGIARAVAFSSRQPLTDSGLTVGTPSYMSPEQAAGSEAIDTRSDLYSLGCVLYEMIGGEPPFPGKTPQAILARHISERPLPISILRDAIPPRLDTLIQKSLKKIPADRFRSAEELQAALDDPRLLEEGSTQGPTGVRRKASLALLGVGMLIGATLGVHLVFFSPGLPLDPNKVVVFPLGDRGGGGLDGAQAALSLVIALEHANPLRPVDGWDLLDPAQRDNVDLLAPAEARAIARGAGASHYLTGTITRRGDSIGVSLTLFATGPDTIAGRESSFGVLRRMVANPLGPDPDDREPSVDEVLSQAGIDAVIKLAPALVDPGRRIDFSHLTDRSPGAIVQWIYGEREYRLSRFESALSHYEAAIAADPLLVLAALKGGQAASWLKDWDRAEALLAAALAHAELLPSRHQHFARGLHHFGLSHTDSAVTHLKAALADYDRWAEAWMALAEVYHHLFPRDLVVDSTDLAYFEKARNLDPGFLPPLIHLAEDALRKGELPKAAGYITALFEAQGYGDQLQRLDLMFTCVDGGASRMDWRGAVQRDVASVLDAGLQLAVGGRQSSCAKAAFRTILDAPEVPRNMAWGAIQGLQGLLVLEDRFEEAQALLDSASAQGYGEAQFYLMVDVLAGAPWEDRARSIEAYVRGRFGDAYLGLRTPSLWVMGAWYAHQKEEARLRAVLAALREKVAGGDRDADTYAKALEGELALLAGDTLGALRLLREALPTGNRTVLTWTVSGSMPLRHLTLAELLMKRGLHSEALRVASIFDHPEPVVFLPFLRRSLTIRLEAAKALRQSHTINQLERRLWSIGVPVN